MAINIGNNADGDVTYQNPPVNRVLFPNITYEAKPEEIQTAINVWLNNHPEATTTVEDGSILPVKLDSSNSATDGYVLSYNATAGKFEWYNINSDITDLRQDFNNIPSSKVSVNIRGKRTHEGIVVYPTIYNIYDSFIAMLTQYDCFYHRDGNARPNTYSVGIVFCVPRKYIHRWKAGSITARKRSNTDLLTIETEGASVQRSSSIGSQDYHSGFLGLNVGFNESDYDETNKYTSTRGFIEIFTDESKTTLERIIYTNQVNFEYLSTSPFDMNVSATSIKEDGVISIGGIKYNDDKIIDKIYTNYINTPISYISTLSGHHGQASGMPVAYTVIPYASSQKSIVAVLEYGTSNFIESNSIDITAPDTTIKSAVSSGDTFMLDGLWYKAITDLAVGDTLVVGTNCTVAEEPTILAKELPTMPTTDGSYHLGVTVTSGTANLSWVADE